MPASPLRVTAHAPAAGALPRVRRRAGFDQREPPRRAAGAHARPRFARMFGDEIDAILNGPLGGLERPTPIRDAISGDTVRFDADRADGRVIERWIFARERGTCLLSSNGSLALPLLNDRAMPTGLSPGATAAPIAVGRVPGRCARGRGGVAACGAQAVNLCEDRYAFLVAFCAVALPRPDQPAAALARAAGDRRKCSPRIPAATRSATMRARRRCRALRARSHSTPTTRARDDRRAGSRRRADRRDRLHLRQHRPAEAEPEDLGERARQHARTTRARSRDAIGLAPGALAHVVATVPPQHMYGLELSVLLPLLGPFARARRQAVLSRPMSPPRSPKCRRRACW